MGKEGRRFQECRVRAEGNVNVIGKQVLRKRRELRVTMAYLAWALCGLLCKGRRKAGREQVEAEAMAGGSLATGPSLVWMPCPGLQEIDVGFGKGSVGRIGREEESEMNPQGDCR